jgi:sulfoxide reductase heme-binding subunit YedZ
MLRLAVFVISLLPLCWILWQGLAGTLGPDPGQGLVLYSGLWALNFLLLTLSVTPLHQWLNWRRPLRYRRMLGLYSFFYASLHLISVATFLLGWDFFTLVSEFKERPYMAFGMSAWLLMLPMAVTSNQWAVKHLKQNWKRLQKSIYAVVLLVCAHFIGQIRSDYLLQLVYSGLIVSLLLARLNLKNYFKVNKQID